MARIVLGSYMVRYPLGGMMSWVLQYVVGLQRLGHEIYFVEKSGYPSSCYDPRKNVMSDDCGYGTTMVESLLERFDLQDCWCFADAGGIYHGMTREQVEAIFDCADLFLDMGTHGAWLEEAAKTGLRVVIDGEPGFTQMKMENALTAGETLPEYDFYYTTGRNVGSARCSAPAAGKRWRHLFHPVVPDLFANDTVGAAGAFTTVMNWQSYECLEYAGVQYGHKDIEFDKFLDLPRLAVEPLEIAVSGKGVPSRDLVNAGWSIRDAHEITRSFDSFREYVRASKGEFSVCKNGYVATHTGWFSDRSAAYLASGRPVVMQDTGFGDHLPVGRGLFSVRSVGEAAAVIAEVSGDYQRHSDWAREVAVECLDATKLLGSFLSDLGL